MLIEFQFTAFDGCTTIRCQGNKRIVFYIWVFRSRARRIVLKYSNQDRPRHLLKLLRVARRYTMHFMSFVHSPSLSLVRRPTSILLYFLCYEWNENLTLQKVAGTAHTSWFTIIFMSLVHNCKFQRGTMPSEVSSLMVTGWIDSSKF